MTSAAAIRTHELTRRFDDVLAVDRLDLTVDDEVFGLLGPNGAGKTTTIKMLITLLPPSAGRAEVAGYDVTHEAGLVRRSIGYVPQLLSADGALTGRENLELSAGLYHLPRAERASRIDQALRFMELDAVADRIVRTYSGGMIRRLELAQAMLHQPAVLFLDEPTVGLDPTGRDAVWARIGQLRERERTTILLTTHHMDEADALCPSRGDHASRGRRGHRHARRAQGHRRTRGDPRRRLPPGDRSRHRRWRNLP